MLLLALYEITEYTLLYGPPRVTVLSFPNWKCLRQLWPPHFSPWCFISPICSSPWSLSVVISRARKHTSFIRGSGFYEENAGSTTIIIIREDGVIITTCIMNPCSPDWPDVRYAVASLLRPPPPPGETPTLNANPALPAP